MKQGCKALELCCGDGFNAYFFYSIRVGSILSVDFDPKAIAYAKRNFRAENVTYQIADIRTQMPDGIFDNVVWDAAIEHFTETEIAELMANIKRRLAPAGMLSGFTIVERPDGKKMRRRRPSCDACLQDRRRDLTGPTTGFSGSNSACSSWWRLL
jgi:SAM-dependent methyltransferase